MKKIFLCFILITAIVFSLSTCNDPIFYYISTEDAPVPPLISGSPVGLVELDSKFYVASGRSLFWYQGIQNGAYTGIWLGFFNFFPGMVYSVAATSTDLYVLHDGAGGNRVISKFNNETIFLGTSSYPGYKIWTLYAAGDELFIGVEENVSSDSVSTSYSIGHSTDGITFTKLLTTGYDLLNGAVFDGTDTYYLSMKNQMSVSGGSIIASTDFPSDITQWTTVLQNIPFMGIIALPNDDIAAIDRNGYLYSISPLIELPVFSFGKSIYSEGVLGICKPIGGSGWLLLAGRQDSLSNTTSSGYTYGYLELELNPVDGSLIFNNPNIIFREPGVNASMNATSIIPGDNSRFKSSIGKHPIKAIYQYETDNGTRILFAATAKSGLWSYRNRIKNGWHWNGEGQFEIAAQ
jgi:hypothetical protein